MFLEIIIGKEHSKRLPIFGVVTHLNFPSIYITIIA